MKTISKTDDFDPAKEKPCNCEHKLQDSGAVFLQSLGWLYCANCKGWQRIRKPIS